MVKEHWERVSAECIIRDHDDAFGCSNTLKVLIHGILGVNELVDRGCCPTKFLGIRVVGDKDFPGCYFHVDGNGIVFRKLLLSFCLLLKLLQLEGMKIL